MKGKFIIYTLLFVVLAQLALAECLDITSVKAYVDGSKDSGTIDLKPGAEELKIKVDVKNTCSFDIVDVDVTATIMDIDEGDNLDEDADKQEDIDAGKDETFTVIFDIPFKLDHEEAPFDLIIEAEGEQKDNSSAKYNDTHSTIMVDVDKEKHDVMIKTISLDSNTLKCSRSTDLTARIVNIGEEDEEDVEISVENSELGVKEKETGIELNSDPFDDENEYSNSYAITVDNDKPAGTYPLSVKVTYDDGDETKTDKIDLTVEDCPAAATAATTTVVTTAPTTAATDEEEITADEEEITAQAAQLVEETPFLSKYGLYLIILAYALVIGIGLVLSVRFWKR